MSNLRRPVLALAITAAAGLTGASRVDAAAYATAVNNLNPVVYYSFNDTAPVSTTANAGTAGTLNLRSTDWTNPGAAVTTVFGNSTTLNPANGFNGFDASNTAATFGTNTIVTNLDPDSATNGTANKTAFKTATAGASALTVSAWANPTSLTPTEQLLFGGVIGNGTGAASFIQLILTPTGVTLGGRSQTSDAFLSGTIAYPAGFDAGEWHNIVGIQDFANDSVSIYIDGTLAGSATTAFGSTTGLTYGSGAGGGAFTMGALYNSVSTTGRGTSVNSKQFAGQLDEVAVFNGALTGSQIADLYAAAVPEPTTLAGIALLGSLAGRRRRA